MKNTSTGFYFLLIFTILLSCQEKTIRYCFEDVCVTRVDFNGRSSFFYGNCNFNKGECDSLEHFDIEYSGFNSGFGLYLIFRCNEKRVEVMPGGGGWYVMEKASPHFFIIDYHPSIRREKLSLFQTDICCGVIRISNSLEYEKELNNESERSSKVKVLYD